MPAIAPPLRPASFALEESEAAEGRAEEDEGRGVVEIGIEVLEREDCIEVLLTAEEVELMLMVELREELADAVTEGDSAARRSRISSCSAAKGKFLLLTCRNDDDNSQRSTLTNRLTLRDRRVVQQGRC